MEAPAGVPSSTPPAGPIAGSTPRHPSSDGSIVVVGSQRHEIQQRSPAANRDMLLEDACRILSADRHTAARLLPLFESARSTPTSSQRQRYVPSQNSSAGEATDCVKASCCAALVSFLLLHVVLPNANPGEDEQAGKELPSKNSQRPEISPRSPRSGIISGSDGRGSSAVVPEGRGSYGASSSTDLNVSRPEGGPVNRSRDSSDEARDDDVVQGSGSSHTSQVENQMLGLATALASFLSEHEAAWQSETYSKFPLTALGVVQHCIHTLNSGTVSQLLLNQPQNEGRTQENDAGNAAVDDEIRRRLDSVVDVLGRVELEINASFASYRELDSLWSWAQTELLNKRKRPLSATEESPPGTESASPSLQTVESARETAWLLQCTLSVVNPSICSEGDRTVSTQATDHHMRSVYLCACVCLLFDGLLCNSASDSGSSAESARRKKRPKTTVEDEREAIAALSMMPNAEPSSPSPGSASPSETSGPNEGPCSPSSNTSDLPSSSALLARLAAKMELSKEQVAEALETVEAWVDRHRLRDARGSNKGGEHERLQGFGSPHQLQTLRHLYHDMLLQKVSAGTSPFTRKDDSATSKWMGVVDEVMLYHERRVRSCLSSVTQIQRLASQHDSDNKEHLRWRKVGRTGSSSWSPDFVQHGIRSLDGGRLHLQTEHRLNRHVHGDRNDEHDDAVTKPGGEGSSVHRERDYRLSDFSSATKSACGQLEFSTSTVRDWISRLCHDPSLAKPSHPLTLHFDHSGGVSLWNTITSILDRALQRLSDCVGDAIAQEGSGVQHMLATENSQAAPNLVSDSGELVRYPSGTGGAAGGTAGLGGRPLGGNAFRHQIQTSVLALYYYSLESIVTLETKRLHTKAHPQLLANPIFHRSLLAVGSQSVLRAMSLNNIIQFPVILDILEIDAYDFLKVSECFVRAVWSREEEALNGGQDHEEHQSRMRFLGLPLELRKHLQECEEMILDKLLWESAPGSGGGIRGAIEAMRHHESDAAWPPFSLRDEGDQQQGRDAGSLVKQLTKQQQQQHVTVSFVFRKLVTLSARRILELSELLSLDAYVTEQIWITWRHCLAEHVYLLYDRHVDQLILCTIYGVCKIARVTPEVSFAKIIESYYELNPGRDRMNQYIIRHIPLGEGKRQGNVIHLYNQVYVPAVKGHLLRFQHYASQQRALEGHTTNEEAGRRGDSSGGGMRDAWHRHPGATYSDPEIVAGRDTSHSSSYASKCGRLPVKGALHTVSPSRVENTNVYVSTCADGQISDVAGSLRRGPHSAQSGMTSRNHLPPHTRSLYSFGEASPSDISLINKTVNQNLHTSQPQHVSISDDDAEHERPQFTRQQQSNGIGVGSRHHPYHPHENNHGSYASRSYVAQRRI